ncbi:MAG: TIR domain-containing protein [Blastocatellia bacterium]
MQKSWHKLPANSQLSDATDSMETFVHSIANRSVWQRIADIVFGYDFFISYASRDGEFYAAHLAKALEQRGFDCFLDNQSYSKGDDWRAVGTAAIRRTSQLVLVGSPQALQSEPVLHEVRVFTATGRKVIPIEFDGTLEEARLQGTPLAKFITPEILRIKEPQKALKEGPADTTLTELQKAFVNRRQSAKRTRALQAVACTLTLLLVVSFVFWRLAERRRVQADMARQNEEVRRKEAEAAKGLAETRRIEANASKQAAEEQRDVATIRQLVRRIAAERGG